MKHPFPLRPIIRIRRYSTVELLVALVLLFVVTPFVQELPSGKVVESVLTTLVLLSGLLAVAGPRRTVMGILFVLPALIARWVDHFRPGLIPIPLIYGTALLFSLFVIIHLLAFVPRAPRVNFEVLDMELFDEKVFGFNGTSVEFCDEMSYWLTDSGTLMESNFIFAVNACQELRAIH